MCGVNVYGGGWVRSGPLHISYGASRFALQPLGELFAEDFGIVADVGWEFGGVEDEFVDVGIGVCGLK